MAKAWLSWHGLWAVLLCGWLPLLAQEPPRSAPPPDEALAKLAKQFKIEVIAAQPAFPVKTFHGVIQGQAAGDKEWQHYVPLFVFEFSLYPASLVQRSKLKRIVLCRALSFAGQRRSAIPDYQHDTLYLDVARGTHSPAYLRKVIHHEFFHLIDYQDDGLVYQDERWSALNPANFKYGRGGASAQEMRETSVLTTRYPGFLNHYSTTAVEEDKAEVFAHLIVDAAYLEERIKTDVVLRAKVQRMKELMAQFCPDMNEAFWQSVSQAKRTER